MLDTPVLFLIFKRPELTEQVFAQIRKAQPKQLFIAADGPRNNKPVEAELCEATRKIVIENIDWPCEVKTLFREKNLGCGKAPAEAITWFFGQVEYGIILEDDCLPILSFFRFCEELLIKYKYDDNIMAISGTNFFEDYKPNNSYFFSLYGGNWGWASWQRAWSKFDYSISDWKTKSSRQKIKTTIANDNFFCYYSIMFDKYSSNIINDVWDYQWLFCRLINNGLSIVPAFNQVKNIGFGTDATHTLNAESTLAKLKTSKLKFPLQSNNNMMADSSYDNKIYEEFLMPAPASKIKLKQKILRRLKSYIEFK